MEKLLSEYELVVGVFLPLLISVFVKESWSKQKKIGISFIFVLLASIGNVFYSGLWNLGDFGGTLLKILVLSVTTYKGFWSATGVTDKIERNVGIKMLVPFLILTGMTFGFMTMQGCPSIQVGGEIAEPWQTAYKKWTPYQRGDFFMELWLSQEADFKAMNAYPNKTEAMIGALKAKRELLEQSRLPLRSYAVLVKSGGVPDENFERQIVEWLTQLQMKMLTLGEGGK